MYSAGEGVPKDVVEAAKWFRMAAEQEDADAQWVLGNMYHQGEGVPKDYAENIKWYRKAAMQGHVEAQYNLGVLYHKGERGVPRDHVESYAWMQVTASIDGQDLGISISDRTLAIKAGGLGGIYNLTPTQIAAAQKRAAKLFEQIKANKLK